MQRLRLPLFILSIYIFLYIPIVVLVAFSFNNAPFPAPWQSFSLMWYYALFRSPEIWRALYNSLTVALVATVLSLGMSIALIYYQLMSRQLSWILSLFYGNIIVPEIVLAVGLLSLLSFLFVPLGLITLIIAHTVLGLGYAVPIIYTRFLELDKRIVDSALDLGATREQAFMTVTLPLLRPALIAAGLLVFILSFDDFILSFFCAGSEAQTLPLYIYSMIRSGISPVVNALSTFLLLLSSILVLIFCSLTTKIKVF
jgi:spermidine/putrescine transport system permease protein